MHRKSGQQGWCMVAFVVQILDAVKNIFSWVFVCTDFLWYLPGDTFTSITRPQDLPQDSFIVSHRVFKAILSPLPVVTCSHKNILTLKVCDFYNRESRGYVHTQGSSSHYIFNPKARGKHLNSPEIVCPSTSSKAFREILCRTADLQHSPPCSWTVESPIPSCRALKGSTCNYRKQEYLLLLRTCVMVW